MFNLIRNFRSTSGETKRFFLAAALVFASLFYTRASESDTRIYYRFDSPVVDPAYLTNHESFATIDEILSASYDGALDIIAYSSPEGNFAYNSDLSQRRAESLRRYIVAKYPRMKGRVTISPDGESWEALRSDVLADTRISEASRQEMLSIIDGSAEPDAKETKLKALPVWRYFYSSYFRTLRFATVRFKFETSSPSTAVSTGIPAEGRGPVAGKTASYAQDGVILFNRNISNIDRNIFDNARVLDVISELLAGKSADEIDGIKIVSTGSPEGPESTNRRLSAERGAALRDYIVSKYPALAGKIKVNAAGEAWEDFRIAVESDPTLTEASRDNILSILVSNSSNDAKEQKLRSLPEWDHILNEIFPGLRYAKIQLDHAPATEPAVISDTPVVIDADDIKIDDEPIAVSDTTLVITDTTMVVPTLPVPVTEPEQEPVQEPEQEPAPKLDDIKPIFAASTNVAYDLGGLIRPMSWTPNFALELPIGQKWSVYGEYAFPWWVTSANDRAWQILKWDIGARRWLSRHNPNDRMDVLRGHFVGIDLGAGYYDIEPRHTGYQGEFQTVGLEYGYAFKLGRAWRLDLFGGVGWMGTHYRYYEGNSTDEHLLYQHHGELQWFGPVKAGVSVKYIFHKNDRRNER